MQIYKCSRCGCFVSDRGVISIGYFDKDKGIGGDRVVFRSELCSDCCKSAIDIFKSFLMKEGEGE